MKSSVLSVSVVAFTLFSAMGVAHHAYAGVAFDGQVLNYQSKQIYDSPYGYTSWVGLWQMPNGAIQADFTQVTGLTSDPYWNAPVLQSTNNGGTWTVVNPDLPATPAISSGGGIYQRAPNAHRSMAVLPNGTTTTMVRPVTNYTTNGDGYVQRSTDGGQTWGSPISFVPPEQYKTWPTLIKPLSDGRLVLMAGVWSRDNTNPIPNANMEKMMFISTDQGQSWGAPISLMPVSTGVCEESDFVELPTGDLMWIHRTEHFDSNGNYLYSDRMESISTKQGDTFVSQTASLAPFPHSGFPLELMTQEGVILDLATTGSHWSSDQGVTWHDLLVDDQPLSTYYYPQAIQTADGMIVVIGHNGSDDPYGTVDQSIVQQTFRLSATHAPEPSTLTLLGIGAVSFFAYIWRRRQRAA